MKHRHESGDAFDDFFDDDVGLIEPGLGTGSDGVVDLDGKCRTSVSGVARDGQAGKRIQLGGNGGGGRWWQRGGGRHRGGRWCHRR